ncbi:MAG: c-type cytochrome biogenesis protein CcmI [Betaproteobacteria bacterium]
MNAFILVGAAMTAAAMVCLAWPLLRRDFGAVAAATAEANLDILRDQLEELRADLARGTISAAQFALARNEIERRVLDEPAAPARTQSTRAEHGRRAGLALVIALPLVALPAYFWIGEPRVLRDGTTAAEQQVAPAEVEAMVAKLAARLEKEPGDARGWAMLAKSYYVMQRMPEAAAAYARAAALTKDDADLFADYADALALTQGRSIEGKPLELVRRALALNPAQPKALAMAGTEAFQRKDYAAAMGFWQRLLPLLPPESEMAQAVAGGIEEARELVGQKAPVGGGSAGPAAKAAGTGSSVPAPGAAPSSGAASVSGSVSVAPSLAGKADSQSTLFIIARAVNGPRMPLAVLRKRAGDLPLTFTLDDALAMSPELRLSQSSEVVVVARISRSGNPIAQSGDLQGTSAAVKVGARGVALVIDSVVP